MGGEKGEARGWGVVGERALGGSVPGISYSQQGDGGWSGRGPGGSVPGISYSQQHAEAAASSLPRAVLGPSHTPGRQQGRCQGTLNGRRGGGVEAGEEVGGG